MSPRGGPYIGPRGGKWADPEHTRPWEGEQGDLVGPEDEGRQASRKNLVAQAEDAVHEAHHAWQAAMHRPDVDTGDKRRAWQTLYDRLDKLGRALNLDVRAGEDWADSAAKWLKMKGEPIHIRPPNKLKPAQPIKGSQGNLFASRIGPRPSPHSLLAALAESIT